ncbi:MAG: apolipoprotein N-acyltransferase [Planctomycetes bacterium]|nr:apolipoprotein N-acyltransferase [Planctomycetota bacterium]
MPSALSPTVTVPATNSARPSDRRAPRPAGEPAAAGLALSPRATALLGLATALLWGLALPPANLWPLGWLAPAPLCVLARYPRFTSRRGYWYLWLAGCAFWLPMLYWLCLAHFSASFGWVPLCLYLAAYLPAFVAIARLAVHRLRWPLVVAAPVVWTGLNLAQAHILSGFDMASIAHTQYRWLHLLQCVDLAGEYGVVFVMFAMGGALASLLPLAGSSRWNWRPLVPATMLLAAVLVYGEVRLRQASTRPGPTITLIQGNIDTELKFSEGEEQRVYDHYMALTRQAYTERPSTDMIVWPETMFRYPLYEIAPNAQLEPGEGPTLEALQGMAVGQRGGLGQLAQMFNSTLLLGIDTVSFGDRTIRRYNSALLVEREGQLAARYDKTHPVLFGEYIPLVDVFPWIEHLSPMGRGIEHGTQPSVVPLRFARGSDTPQSVGISINICYETVLPHVVRNLARQQVALGPAAGREPEVIVNLTNDGWFWGSHELDLHMICGVFRAVELRKPFLAAANTGFSVWIDGDGEIVRQGPRHDVGWIVADVELDNRSSLYYRTGDWFAGCCLLGCVGILVAAGVKRRFAGAAA